MNKILSIYVTLFGNAAHYTNQQSSEILYFILVNTAYSDTISSQ
jgi:hypothetical protein